MSLKELYRLHEMRRQLQKTHLVIIMLILYQKFLLLRYCNIIGVQHQGRQPLFAKLIIIRMRRLSAMMVYLHSFHFSPQSRSMYSDLLCSFFHSPPVLSKGLKDQIPFKFIEGLLFFAISPMRTIFL